ncbi:hypothetical protein J6590_031970, partial [Homalodisca vitripennis]
WLRMDWTTGPVAAQGRQVPPMAVPRVPKYSQRPSTQLERRAATACTSITSPILTPLHVPSH